jgi:hypothetical protein
LNLIKTAITAAADTTPAKVTAKPPKEPVYWVFIVLPLLIAATFEQRSKTVMVVRLVTAAVLAPVKEFQRRSVEPEVETDGRADAM